ncbi:MAG: PIG-L deacetylase family protein [Aggregatilineales bacterium]
MAEPLKLMCILAHPDDESQGFGGALAKYAAEGVETYLITATRGERDWPGDPKENPGLVELGKIREGELRASAKILGIREVCLLDYVDGDRDQADSVEAVAKIVTHVRRIRPQLVLTFALDGAYGHPDHIAISQLTVAALVAAADLSYPDPGVPHRVAKLYYKVDVQAEVEVYTALFGDIVMPVDGVDRHIRAWPAWSISAWIEAGNHAETVQQAMACHQSQFPNFSAIAPLLAQTGRQLCDLQTYVRVYSLVNGGRRLETDLFEGLR